jgi:hypothetical protein
MYCSNACLQVRSDHLRSPDKHPPVFLSKAGAKVESFFLLTKCFGKKIQTFFS